MHSRHVLRRWRVGLSAPSRRYKSASMLKGRGEVSLKFVLAIPSSSAPARSLGPFQRSRRSTLMQSHSLQQRQQGPWLGLTTSIELTSARLEHDSCTAQMIALEKCDGQARLENAESVSCSRNPTVLYTVMIVHAVHIIGIYYDDVVNMNPSIENWGDDTVS